MAFKVYVPTTDIGWGGYWDRTSIEKDLKLCLTDGLLPILQKYLSQTDKALEAGCGLGKWVIFLRRMGYQVYGVDSYHQAITNLKKFDNSLPLKVGKVELLPYNKNFF